MKQQLSSGTAVKPGNQSGGALSFFYTLRARLIFSVALVHVVLMSLFTWNAVERQSQELRQDLLDQGSSLASLMVVASTNALLAEDLASLAEVTRRVGEQSDVTYGEVVDVRGYVMASTRAGRVGKHIKTLCKQNDNFPLAPEDLILDLCEAIQIGNNQVGFVRLGMAINNLSQALEATRDRGLQSIILALIIGSIAAWLFSMTVTRNLQELTTAAGHIGKGNFDVRIKVSGRDETSTLAHAFNLMTASLQKGSREMEQEHRKRTDAERLACVGEMAASIAHEIRNPLAALINSVKLLGNTELTVNDRSEVVNIVDKESHRLQRILSEFLSFARLASSVPVESDLKLLIEETVILVRRDPAYHQGITIQSHYGESMGDYYGYFDWDQIRQVMLNLMLNAVQSIVKKGRLDLYLQRHGKCLQVNIVDSGAGIPESKMKDVIKPFVTSRKEGTGLGLSIVQRILMQHGTSLIITSIERVGTEVAFELEAKI
jgi:two-component system, NtrC family, sensor histidine kinase HydH